MSGCCIITNSGHSGRRAVHNHPRHARPHHPLIQHSHPLRARRCLLGRWRGCPRRLLQHPLPVHIKNRSVRRIDRKQHDSTLAWRQQNRSSVKRNRSKPRQLAWGVKRRRGVRDEVLHRDGHGARGLRHLVDHDRRWHLGRRRPRTQPAQRVEPATIPQSATEPEVPERTFQISLLIKA